MLIEIICFLKQTLSVNEQILPDLDVSDDEIYKKTKAMLNRATRWLVISIILIP
jgi:hypothetical protein